MTPPHDAGRCDYAGLALVALATLMLEILLTRIFSVTLWYHLAFVAVSIAMFGMTLGSVIVYLLPNWFTPARVWTNLAVSSTLFALTAVWSVQAHLRQALDPSGLSSPLTQLSLAYCTIAVPFVFSGIAVSLALTQFPSQVSRLYAADLAGAALGCVLLIVVLEVVGGPWAVWAVAGAAGVAALLFALGSASRRTRGRTAALSGFIALSIGVTVGSLATRPRAFQIRHAKGTRSAKPMYEKWNSYSRIAVGVPRWEAPFGWGLSDAYEQRFLVQQLHLNIDASAETVLTHFDGDLNLLDYLKYDVTNIGHYLTKDGSVFVVGAGGGRDVLSALVFGQKRVVAVEMNRAITEAVNGTFGNVTGHLDRLPNVRFVNDEARSYLARSRERFDLIQISLIDTWAATAAGAFVLSENTLYTTDAWKIFLDRLTANGVLSVSRWHSRPVPAETYKLAVLATTALRQAGIVEPRKHLMIVATDGKADGREDVPGIATLLLGRSPFSDAEVATIESVARRMSFEVVLSPRGATDAGFAALADLRQLDGFVAGFDQDLSAPDDNRPFFFKMDSGLLNGLFAFVLGLAVTFIVVPVLLKSEVRVLRLDAAPLVSFAGIGVAFMLIEISQMQRLTVLLGHPTFSLSVALSGLLVSSGAGSFSTHALGAPGMARGTVARLAGLVGVLSLIGLATPGLVRMFQASATPIRVALALALLAPAGFFMGMVFPVAMRIASWQRPRLMPWLWGINGAASVCASVLAVIISSSWGISAAWWIGVLCYIIASGPIVIAARTADQSSALPPRS